MRELLENKDLLGFLQLYEAQGQLLMSQPGAGGCTQRLLPALCRELLSRNSAQAEAVVLLWKLIRGGQLLVVDNDILQHVNERIDQALSDCKSSTTVPAPPLRLYDQEAPEPVKPRPVQVPQRPQESFSMERVVICSSFTFGFYGMSDTFNFKKNLCASSQEREFLKAVRQYFPSLRAYPNLPLRNFIDLDALDGLADEQMRRFCWSSQVDALLCTEDEDPIAGIELDSTHHDDSAAMERDALKDKLFAIAGVPLVRIRAENTSNVRAEDFYELLLAQAETLGELRPRQLQPRRNYDTLIPAGSRARRAAVMSR
jgi:hypothetical protein